MPTAALHITTISQTDRTLAAAVLLLTAGTAIALVAVHLLDRGVNPLSMAVSEFGVREHAWFYRLAVIWLGLAGLLTAVLFADAVYPKPSLTILCLLVFAATRWVVTIFPIDATGEQATSTGRAHLVLGAAAFASIAAAAFLFAIAVGNDAFWTPHHGLLALLGWALPVVAALMALSRWLASSVFGLVERFYYLCIFAWLTAVAVIVLSA